VGCCLGAVTNVSRDDSTLNRRSAVQDARPICIGAADVARTIGSQIQASTGSRRRLNLEADFAHPRRIQALYSEQRDCPRCCTMLRPPVGQIQCWDGPSSSAWLGQPRPCACRASAIRLSASPTVRQLIKIHVASLRLGKHPVVLPFLFHVVLNFPAIPSTWPIARCWQGRGAACGTARTIN
jgi:hypothetical protein